MAEQKNQFRILRGDCVERMRELPDNSVHAVVTDPPYGLSKQPDMAEVLRHWLAGDDYVHKGRGFMGKSWDSFVPGPSVWRECLRVLKPGGHVLAFFGTRTYDLGVLAIRLAGFEIRDQLAWVYGSGFPKSQNVSKAIDKASGAERKVIAEGKAVKRMIPGADQDKTGSWIKGNGREYVPTVTEAATPEAAEWEGWGTALKPAQEPIVLARKPLTGTVAANVQEHGTGALNIDGCRVSTSAERPLVGSDRRSGANRTYGDGLGGSKALGTTDQGRWPANLVHDGSDEVLAAFPDAPGQQRSVGPEHGEKASVNVYGDYGARDTFNPRGDKGSAARFFYAAKASRRDRTEGGLVENTHPTVKPTPLMRYLVRLITPPGGTVLDPYTGSGSTGKAAILEGFEFIGCELIDEHADIAEARMKAQRSARAVPPSGDMGQITLDDQLDWVGASS